MYASKHVCQAAVTDDRRGSRGKPLDVKKLLAFTKKFDACVDNRGVWEVRSAGPGGAPSLYRLVLFSGAAKRLAVSGALQPIVSVDASFMTLRWTAKTVGEALPDLLRGGARLRPNATVDVKMGGLFAIVGRTYFNSNVLLGVAWVSGETEVNLRWCLQQYANHFRGTVVCPAVAPFDPAADDEAAREPVPKSMVVFTDYGQAVRNAVKAELPAAHAAHCVVHFKVWFD